METKEKKQEEQCEDERCPEHGSLKVRGRYFEGYVQKIVGKRVVIKWERIRYIPKYERYYRTHSKLHAYLPSCIPAKVGDLVRVGECRPLSKIVSFVVVSIVKHEEKK